MLNTGGGADYTPASGGVLTFDVDSLPPRTVWYIGSAFIS